MTRRLAPSASRIRSEQRPERLGLALGDAARRLVEQEHGRLVGEDAREVDDAPAAGRQLADELVAERAEAHELDELVDPVARPPASESTTAGRCSAAAIGSRTSTLHSSATAIVSATVERREEAPVLERATEPEPGPRLRRLAADVVDLALRVARASIVPIVLGREPGDDVEQRGLAGAVRADEADDLAGADRERHVVERGDAAEALR